MTQNNETEYNSVNGPYYPHWICRFCSTRDQRLDFVCRDATNKWSAAICENCVVAVHQALCALKKQRIAGKTPPNGTAA